MANKDSASHGHLIQYEQLGARGKRAEDLAILHGETVNTYVSSLIHHIAPNWMTSDPEIKCLILSIEPAPGGQMWKHQGSHFSGTQCCFICAYKPRLQRRGCKWRHCDIMYFHIQGLRVQGIFEEHASEMLDSIARASKSASC